MNLHLNSHPSQPGLFFSFPDIDILYIVEERESESSPQFPSQSTWAILSFPAIVKHVLLSSELIFHHRQALSSLQFSIFDPGQPETLFFPVHLGPFFR